MNFLEAGMLICFGLAWPVSIYKSIVSRSIEGKSVFFLIVVFIGYIFGILHKILADFDFVFYLYILNSLMVLTDIILYFRNYRYQKSKKNRTE